MEKKLVLIGNPSIMKLNYLYHTMLEYFEKNGVDVKKRNRAIRIITDLYDVHFIRSDDAVTWRHYTSRYVDIVFMKPDYCKYENADLFFNYQALLEHLNKETKKMTNKEKRTIKCSPLIFNVGYRNPKIEKVIFNAPATIVMWSDGTKTVVKAEGEKFDEEKGLAMAISKKFLGNKGNYYEEFKKWLPEKDIYRFVDILKRMNRLADASSAYGLMTSDICRKAFDLPSLMYPNDYQKLAMRTCGIPYDNKKAMLEHATHGLAAEAGEVNGILQKEYQGHEFDKEHMKKELGDCLWMIAEACTALDLTLEEVMEANIQKLKERFPEGFDPDKSLHRKEGDI